VLASITCTVTITAIVSGAVDITKDTSCIDNATVGGTVVVTAGAALVVLNSTLHGAVVSNGATAVTICNSTVGGSVTVQRTTRLVLIGAGDDGGVACASDPILGGVVLGGSRPGNTGGIELSSNLISGGVGGAVTVIGNVAPNRGAPTENNAIEIEGNTIDGAINCNGNTPAPTTRRVTNKVSGASNGQCSGI
jgi:hypothetical protein